MARNKKGDGKSESITMRLDAQTRFLLEFLSRAKGQTMTTVVERAVVAAADQAASELDFNWRSLWSVSEAERALALASIPALYPSTQEQTQWFFVNHFWPFFFTDSSRTRLMTAYVDVLHPQLDHFIQVYEDTKTKDWSAAGRAMAEALKAASLEPPEWPIEGYEPPPSRDSWIYKDRARPFRWEQRPDREEESGP